MSARVSIHAKEVRARAQYFPEQQNYAPFSIVRITFGDENETEVNIYLNDAGLAQRIAEGITNARG